MRRFVSVFVINPKEISMSRGWELIPFFLGQGVVTTVIRGPVLKRLRIPLDSLGRGRVTLMYGDHFISVEVLSGPDDQTSVLCDVDIRALDLEYLARS